MRMLYELAGTISHAGFSSGHRFVVGRWAESPVGPMNDVMWARPDGERVLLVDRPEAGRFITAVYEFDRVEVVDLRCEDRPDGFALRAAAPSAEGQRPGVRLELELRAGRQWPIPLPALRRSVAFRPIERVIARTLLGVRTFGESPTGVREWYRADAYRRVVAARAGADGQDLGHLTRFHRPAGFGFSEPPRSPAVVRVQPQLEDRTGRLTAALAPGPPAAGRLDAGRPTAQESGGPTD